MATGTMRSCQHRRKLSYVIFARVLTYYQHPVTNAMSEGLTSQMQKIKSMTCGFRNTEHFKTAIYFHCGGLDLYPC